MTAANCSIEKKRHTYHIMSVRGAIYQANFTSLVLRDKHIKAFAEAELTHHIIREVTKPISHVLDIAFLIMRIEISIIPSEHGAQLTHMEEHHILHPFESIIRESLAKHSSLATMHGFIDRIVRVIHTLDGREGIIEISLLEAFSMPVDVVQSTVRVDGDEIRSDAHVCPVLAVQLVQPEMAITLQAMVELDPGCDRCKEWAVDTMKWVDEAVVEGVGQCLG